MKKFFIMLLMLTVLLFSCTETISEVKIDNGESLTIEVGESASLTVTMNFETTLAPIWTSSKDIVTVDNNGNVKGIKAGTATITVA